MVLKRNDRRIVARVEWKHLTLTRASSTLLSCHSTELIWNFNLRASAKYPLSLVNFLLKHLFSEYLIYSRNITRQLILFSHTFSSFLSELLDIDCLNIFYSLEILLLTCWTGYHMLVKMFIMSFYAWAKWKQFINCTVNNSLWNNSVTNIWSNQYLIKF